MDNSQRKTQGQIKFATWKPPKQELKIIVQNSAKSVIQIFDKETGKINYIYKYIYIYIYKYSYISLYLYNYLSTFKNL